MIGIGWVKGEPASGAGPLAEAAVTDESVVGNEPVAAVLFGFWAAVDATTLLSVVGNSGGGLVSGWDALEFSADAVSAF